MKTSGSQDLVGSSPTGSAKKWILSKEGKKAFKKAMKEIEKSEEELREARRIRPEDLMRVWG